MTKPALLIISDLHLQSSRPDITATLLYFLRTKAPDAACLYVLGDLFEVWIGDDVPNPLGDQVAEAMRALSNQGVTIYLMHGNRDFLLGEEYAGRCEAELILEPRVLEVANRRFALLHGDVLCTRDTAYQDFRNIVRNPDWQTAFLARSVEERLAFARQAREQSKRVTAGQEAAIMDVTEAAVAEMFRDLQVDTLIHGHTHRPAIHDLPSSPAAGDYRLLQRVVLGDWDNQGWFAEINDHGEVTLHQFPLTSG